MQNLAFPATLLALAAVTAGAVVTILPASHAEHQDEANSEYFWDRSTAGGHRNLLNCQPAPNEDRCAVPFRVLPSVANVATKPGADPISVRTAQSEVLRAINTVNRAVEYIGIQAASNTENMIKGKVLIPTQNGLSDNPRHCTAFPGCFGPFGSWDSHIAKAVVYINTNQLVVFGTTEECSGRTVIVRDIEKTIAHELWHILGSDHSSESDSIVNPQYLCDIGAVPNVHDKELMRDKYPRGVK